MKKAVFFDIDGTLWDGQMRLPESTAEAVRLLREGGNYAFLCSGRSRACIRSERLLGIGFDGVVAACGAHIDFHGKKVYERLLSKGQVRRAFDVVERRQMLAVYEGPDYIYIDKEMTSGNSYVDYLKGELGEDVKDLSEGDGIVINKLSVELRGSQPDDVLRDLGEDFDIIAHNEWIAEIVLKGCSKATGIAEVLRLLGIPREDTYAFGDSVNDLEMLRYVAHGIAMGNGSDAAKEAAEYVTSDISADGIRNGLRHYGLI